ncbi:hypothetical protein GCM10010329_30370 [Streptomyces spiroverticillatus]|uniref:Lipoprotein n=1 Tax=Streptomyces finlayi TaxID=67296 RepID=A0A918WVX8_9ACTN|nr:hypothetical protein [Streptomyces finlayi]GHA05795.1 hypothetical protein GCM10010329_30370 [Streptomyces spiroverticillatus]GHC89563.1 hypothetical protein GCM10010334_22780 [Streptomyces finlayi]
MRLRYARAGALPALALALVTACAGPAQYYEGSGLHDATPTEATGDWSGAEGTRVTLRPDGTATLRRLDGQDFDFDTGWRLTGTGTWKLSDARAGQRVRLTLAKRTAVDRRTPATPAPDAPAPDASAPETPSTYTWSLDVRRNPQKALELYFFFGDPDAGNTYVLRRTG